MSTIHQQLKDINAVTGTHYSDLYCEVNEATRAIIAKYEYKCNVRTFRNQVTGKLNFDIPFANDDYKKFNQKAGQ